MIKSAAALAIIASLAVSGAESTDTVDRFSGILTTDYGNAVFLDDMNLLSESEEKNILITIVEAVKEKDISVGVVTTANVSDNTADIIYSMISDDDADFALMLFNEDDYSYYFYGEAKTEFENANEEFWMTNAYMDEKHYFVGGLQFPLDIRYHTPSEIPADTTDAETDSSESSEDINELSENGIHTVGLNNGCTAFLHDLDNSLDETQETNILEDLMEAVYDKGFSIGIVITDDIGTDKSDYGVMDFSDIYYEKYCGMDTDGIMLLINNDNNYDWLSTSGSCIDMFYGRDDDIFNAIYDYLKEGNYYYACQKFVQDVSYYSEQDYTDYDYDDDDGYSIHFSSEDFEDVFTLILVAGIFAFIAISIFQVGIKTSYKMKKNVTAANYKLENSLVFSQQTDTYIRQYTTRRTVSSSSSGSGGGSRSRSSSGSRSRSHRSSSGGRHGGGGRRR